MDRREFIKNVARGSILVGLGLVAGTLLSREDENENCDFDFICNNCNKLNKCNLPEAVKFKETGKLNK
ncbi:MAG: hypothetical protein HY951_13255 [Bacteroidia bacterium]|nr:hypothetical protein [Bacteroidia bacterium]